MLCLRGQTSPVSTPERKALKKEKCAQKKAVGINYEPQWKKQATWLPASGPAAVWPSGTFTR